MYSNTNKLIHPWKINQMLQIAYNIGKYNIHKLTNIKRVFRSVVPIVFQNAFC
jgi:hypothetical protein